MGAPKLAALVFLELFCGATSVVGDGVDSGWYAARARSPSDASSAVHAFSAGRRARDQEDYKAAIESFRTVTAVAPEVADGWLNLGVLFEEIDAGSEAVRIYQRGLQVPSCKHCRKKLIPALCTVMLHEIEFEGRLHEFGGAALQHCGEAARAAETGKVERANLAALYIQLGRFSDAEAVLLPLSREYPSDAAILHNYVNALLRSGRGDQAALLAPRLVSLPSTRAERSASLSLASAVLSTTQPDSSQAIQWAEAAQSNYVASVAASHAVPSFRKSIRLVTNPIPSELVAEFFPAAESPGTADHCLAPEPGVGYQPVLNQPGWLACPSAVGVQPPLRYDGKLTVVVSFARHYLVGPAGVVLSAAGRIYAGDHLFHAPLRGGVRAHHFPPADRTVEHPFAAASILQAKTANHYHWTVEACARLVTLFDSGAAFPTGIFPQAAVKLVVPSDNPLTLETVRLLLRGLFPGPGYEPARRVFLSQSVVPYQDLGGTPRSRHLFPSIFTVFHHPLDATRLRDPWQPFFPPPPALLSLRRGFRGALGAAAQPPPRGGRGVCGGGSNCVVYAGRAGEAVRSVDGGGRVVELLRAKFGPEAVRVHEGAAGEPLEGQLRDFAGARVVVGPHGAALANCVVLRPGAVLVVFPLLPPVDRAWAHMAAALGLVYREVPELAAFYYSHYNPMHVKTSGFLNQPFFRERASDTATRKIHMAVYLSGPCAHTGAGASLEGQLRDFAGARVVVGPHGAALANCVVLRPGAVLVVFPLLPPVDRAWAHMAAALGLLYREVAAFCYSHDNVTQRALHALSRILDEALGLREMSCTSP
ncbi:hypothetical protein DIPPA_26921 [Diplonema papillatum]|nr:hypothetical protein DIPPA_26921 [Diplonema papillatum]